jgi:hypothetical protein
MKLTTPQIESLVAKVFGHWKKDNIVTFKDDEKKIFARAVEYIKKDFQKETELEHDVQKKLDELERSNPGEFQRHKMFQMLKQKMAKERKMVL